VRNPHMTRSSVSNGGTATAPAASMHDYPAPAGTGPVSAPGTATARNVTAQTATALAVLAGLWVAISPWFLELQAVGANATVTDLIVGLAVAGLGALALSGGHGFTGLQAASGLAGAWLIISPFILAAKVAIATPMYWSNIFAGAAIIVLAATAAGARSAANPR
jgi:SPW repeat